MDFQPVAYPIFGGVDTKIHGFVLPKPKLQEVINAYSDKSGSLRRRFGRTAVTSLEQSGSAISGNPLALASYQGRLIQFTDASKLYDYSEADSRWTDCGRATSYRVQKRQVAQGDPSSNIVGTGDMAILGSYRCYAYDIYSPGTGTNTTTTTYFTLMDSNGQRLAAKQQLVTLDSANAMTSGVKVVAFGTRFYIVFYDYTTAGTLKTFLIDTTSAATIAASLAAAAASTDTLLAIPDNGGRFDVAVNPVYGPFAAYRITTGAPDEIKFGFISTAGAITSTSTSVPVADPIHIAVDVTGSATHGIAYAAGTTPNDVYALIRSWNGSAWTATATSAAMDTALGSAVTQLGCHFSPGTTTLRVYYGTVITAYRGIRQGTYTSAGVIVSRTTLLVRSILASRPFTGADGAAYYWVSSEPVDGVSQPTLYLMTQDGVLAAVANQGIAATQEFENIGGLPHVVVASGSYSTLQPNFLTITRALLKSVPGVGTTHAQAELILDQSHAQSHVSVEDGSCLYIPSGVLQMYDGVKPVEVGFLSFVDTANRVTIGAAEITNGAGSLTNAANTIYSYHIVPESTNGQGEREQGTDSGAKTTLAADWLAGDDTVAFTIDCIPWTLKAIRFAVYRTLANPTADSPFYRVGTIANDTSAETVTFTDLMSDATAALQEQFYADTELDHVAPPPGYIIAAGNGRVFMAGLADDPGRIVYSKLRGYGQPLAFNDALTIQMPQNAGAITAMCVMADALIVFTETALYRVNGDGLNNVGGGGGYATPQLIITDGGCLGPRCATLTPLGIFYQSLKGLMLLGPGHQAVYIGAPLEKIGDPGIATGMTVIPELQQVRVSFDNTTHVYDYYHQQWYVFTHASDGPTTLWNDVIAAIQDAVVVYDNPAVWTDDGDTYAMTITLGWEKFPATLQGDMRFRRVGVTGESLGSHYLQIYVSYDYASTPTDTLEGLSLLSTGILKKQYRLSRQIAMAVEVSIRDAILDVYAADVVNATAGMQLNEVVFEVGVRSGVASRRI